MKKMNDNKIEFRRGSAGVGNQLRQPYLIELFEKKNIKIFPKLIIFTSMGFILVIFLREK